MAYEKSIGANNPSMILMLVDQSGSMDESFSGSDKRTHAAQAVNRVIYEIIQNSQKGDGYSDRCYIGVIGYGENVDLLVGGMVSEVNDHPLDIVQIPQKTGDGAGGLVDTILTMGVWVTPKAENGTPMAEAFEMAYGLLENWIANHPDCFPPVVFNISDGMPNDKNKARNNALSIMQLSTSDGNVLFFNAHIQEAPYEQIVLPSDSNYLEEEAKFLFDISSIIPEVMAKKASAVGFTPKEGARAFVYKASAENLIKLLTFGSTVTGFRR